MFKRRLSLPPPGTETRAFENWVFHELSAYLDYSGDGHDLSYWRLAGGTEVDFVVGDMEVALEAKGGERAGSRHLKSLRSLKKDHPNVARRVVVCLEPRARRTEEGIDVLPADAFAKQLWERSLV